MRIASVLLLLLAAVTFAAQNASVVTITVLAWRLDASLAIVVAIAVAVGAIGGVLAGVPRLYRMRAHEKRLRAQLAGLAGHDSLAGDTHATPGEALTRGKSLTPASRKPA